MTKKCSDTELNLLRTPWPKDTPRDDECDGYSQVTVSSPRPGPENQVWTRDLISTELVVSTGPSDFETLENRQKHL